MRVRIIVLGKQYHILAWGGNVLAQGPTSQITNFIGTRQSAYFKAIKHKNQLILQSEVGGWYGP